MAGCRALRGVIRPTSKCLAMCSKTLGPTTLRAANRQAEVSLCVHSGQLGKARPGRRYGSAKNCISGT